MKIMDRYLFANFLVAYVICFVSMVGLYVVIDLFSNYDEFIEDHAGTVAFVRRVVKYYGIHSFEYFGKLSPIITQIAAMTTLASLHRNNEIIALLAAGVPTRRALMPILGGVGVVIALGIVNREYILPANADMLQRMHEAIETNTAIGPAMRIDEDQILFRARSAHREDQRIEDVNVTLPMEIVGQLQEIHCSVAYYKLDEESGRMGWLLVNPSPVQIIRPHDKIKRLENGDLVIFSSITFKDMIRQRTWLNYASTFDLVRELQYRKIKNPQDVKVMIHSRIMLPALNVLLVLIGIPFVLQWERKNLYRSIFVSMLLSALFFVVDTTSGYFASHGYLDPMTAAWVPVFIFGPISFALFHRIGT